MSSEKVIKAIDNHAKSVKTKSLDISFNELLDMYNNQELIINPDYQRMFRWSEEKQSMFIESLILEMPFANSSSLRYLISSDHSTAVGFPAFGITDSL